MEAAASYMQLVTSRILLYVVPAISNKAAAVKLSDKAAHAVKIILIQLMDTTAMDAIIKL